MVLVDCYIRRLPYAAVMLTYQLLRGAVESA